MKQVIFVLIVGVLFVMIHHFQVNHYVQKTIYHNMNAALKHAVHDAALFVDFEQASEGVIVFDQLQGHAAFLETMQHNLPLNENLEPDQTLFIKQPLILLEMSYLDHHSIDPLTGSEMTFPYTYEYQDTVSGWQLERTLFGPSVIYIIEAQLFQSDAPHPFITIQEYIDF